MPTTNQHLIGQRYPCGTITRRLRRIGKNRSIIVQFRCAQCTRLGSARLGDAKSGRQKSCGCLKRKQSISFTTTRAMNLSANTRREIFEMRIFGASYQDVAKRTGVKYRLTVDRAVFIEKQKLLASIPDLVQQQWLQDVRSGETSLKSISEPSVIPSKPMGRFEGQACHRTQHRNCRGS